MKTLTIIGAGISGLICGIYAQRSGFRTTILEKAGNPGGVSTSWKRKGYTFEGGIHWLIGAKTGVPLNDIWTETGALQANNPVFFKDPVYTLLDSGLQLDLRRDLSTLKQYAPEDRIPLALMRFHVWCFSFFHSPVQDISDLKVRHPRKFSLTEFIKMGPAVLLTPWLMSFSARTYIRRFRNPHLRHLLESVVDPDINALSLIYTLSSFSSGDSGYPEGGSLRMAQNMADTFTKLGGQILYRTPALEVVREGDTIKGVHTAQDLLESDAVVISMDARTAIDKLFTPALQAPWASRMRRKLRTAQCMFIALGVHADLSARPRCMQIMLNEPLHAGGLSFNALTVNNYSRDPEYAPEGCTAVTCILSGPSYKYWKQAREDGKYAALKQEAIADFISALSTALPEIKDKVEVTDMATPLTYERYCDTFEGSYMSEWKPCHFCYNAPLRVSHGLYFTGQRTAFSGGLPVAAETGRRCAQVVCRDFGAEFVSR
ncbi:MAG: NAD(P)/FAD-dependent oxidoreductase [Bacteroidales bacterium]|nr:NAD(P)/FAD-dependent oxidoreductase [Bacteroidales bacterium]